MHLTQALRTAARSNYPGHVPLTTAQNALLAVGSGVMGVLDTSRGGESTLKVGCRPLKPDRRPHRYAFRVHRDDVPALVARSDDRPSGRPADHARSAVHR